MAADQNLPATRKWWDSAPVVSSLTAIVVMIVTAAAGYFTQHAIRKQEFTLARSDERLRQTREAITSIYELLASMMFVTTERWKVATGQYDQLTDQQLKTLIDDLNRTDARWARERESSEMLIFLYFRNGASAQTSWPEVKRGVQSYIDCVERIYLQNLSSAAPRSACEAERNAAESNVERLRKGFVEEYTASFTKP